MQHANCVNLYWEFLPSVIVVAETYIFKMCKFKWNCRDRETKCIQDFILLYTANHHGEILISEPYIKWFVNSLVNSNLQELELASSNTIHTFTNAIARLITCARCL